ncbi:hypothetical protein ThimaDRAFT_1993 [Thiocapsa marina 5811]|uniref:Uncharacterized protein n=1 Tax=Thiocapsa marina 5811 TaxID=768671 RepID=F9UAV7_9GAMM|nr:hypothetical protein ThimaDRAFT_1993 [Thiocapsa marina 5811]
MLRFATPQRSHRRRKAQARAGGPGSDIQGGGGGSSSFDERLSFPAKNNAATATAMSSIKNTAIREAARFIVRVDPPGWARARVPGLEP